MDKTTNDNGSHYCEECHSWHYGRVYTFAHRCHCQGRVVYLCQRCHYKLVTRFWTIPEIPVG